MKYTYRHDEERCVFVVVDERQEVNGAVADVYTPSEKSPNAEARAHILCHMTHSFALNAHRARQRARLLLVSRNVLNIYIMSVYTRNYSRHVSSIFKDRLLTPSTALFRHRRCYATAAKSATRKPSSTKATRAAEQDDVMPLEKRLEVLEFLEKCVFLFRRDICECPEAEFECLRDFGIGNFACGFGIDCTLND